MIASPVENPPSNKRKRHDEEENDARHIVLSETVLSFISQENLNLKREMENLQQKMIELEREATNNLQLATLLLLNSMKSKQCSDVLLMENTKLKKENESLRNLLVLSVSSPRTH